MPTASVGASAPGSAVVRVAQTTATTNGEPVADAGVVASPAYAVAVTLGACAAFAIRRVEGRRLGYVRQRGYRWVGVSCLIGAMVGARLGMIFYLPLEDFAQLWWRLGEFRFDGKTVIGAITGGYLGGELGKKAAGVRFSTGDALAVALPVGQAFGRIGCYFAECCYGAPTQVTWAVHSHGLTRHPVQLYEAALCLVLAAILFTVRTRPRRPGHLFRYYLIGYAAIRFSLEFLRGEPQQMLGPLSSAQVYCAVMAVILGASLWRARPRARETESSAGW